MNQQDWDGLRLLLAVHAAGSLRGAAETLTISQPTLGRRLRELEGTLGHPLLLRHARGVVLTDEGHAALEVAQRVEAQLGALQRTLSGRAAAAEGRVRVSCTEPVATDLLPDVLMRLRDLHPRLCVDVVVDAHASDLDRREADIAIRMFAPTQPALVARRIGQTYTAFYATHAYLARSGRPQKLSDLAQHSVIGPDRDQLFVQQATRLGFATDAMSYRTDSFAAVLAWVRRGVAIGALLGAVADRDPDLVQLFDPIAQHPVWLVTHPDLRTSAAVSAVWNQLAVDLPGTMLREPVEE